MGWARGAAVVAVALAVALFGAWLLGWSSNLDPVEAVQGEVATVVVPDLSGLARPRGIADVESAGLVAEVRTTFSLTAPRGAVVAQDPVAGRHVPADSTVVITVSRGVTRVEMPDAVGRPLEEIVVPLDEVGVDYAVDRVPSETVAAGLVIEQTPEASKRVTAADSISFVVSSGPEPRPVLDVSGLSAEGAAFALGRAGFLIEEVEPREDPGVVLGAVIETDPAAGTVLPRDTALTLIVSSGPPPVALTDLRGGSQEAAVSELQSLGLVANVIGGGPTGGRIVAQSPAPGTVLDQGAVVSVEVSGG